MTTPAEREHRVKWAEALMSGEYLQAQGSFTEIDSLTGKVKHCCLAVATDLAIKDGVDTIKWGKDESPLGPSYLPVLVALPPDEYVDDFTIHHVDENNVRWVEYTDGNLPGPTMHWLGFTDDNPMLDGQRAIDRNDAEEQPFEEIARAVYAEAGEDPPYPS